MNWFLLVGLGKLSSPDFKVSFSSVDLNSFCCTRGAFALQLLSQFIGDFGFERFYDSQGYPDMKKVDAVFDMLEGARVRRVCLPPVLGRDNMVLALGLFDTVGAVFVFICSNQVGAY